MVADALLTKSYVGLEETARARLECQYSDAYLYCYLSGRYLEYLEVVFPIGISAVPVVGACGAVVDDLPGTGRLQLVECGSL